MSNLNDGGSFIAGGSWSTPNSSAYFPDPFLDMASLTVPQTMQYALRWCEFLMFANGTYFRALDRIISYFITDIEISDVEDDEEKQKIYDYLHDPDKVDILDDLHTGGLNYMVYGNEFTSVLMPFKRRLVCPNCGLGPFPLKTVFNSNEFKFKWTNCEFNAHCPRCKFTGAWKHIDQRLGEAGKVKVKHWSPHEIELLYDPYSDEVDYIWKIPEDYRKLIDKGHLFHLERIPHEVIQCVKNKTNLIFEKDAIYHMKEPTLSGIRNRGWGVSRVLSNFRQAWYVQVLHRYNEAIALDYVIPFRLITPAPGPGSADVARDALMNLNMGGYMTQVQRMLRHRRRDPATWHTLPFPVQYQALGGDATQLAPTDLLGQGIEVLLNNVGIPIELYKGSLQVQSAPAALRLFESSWTHLSYCLNGYIGFIMRRIGQLLNWEKATARLQKVTHADDMTRHMAKLQLMMGGQVSKQTGLHSIGIDYFDETKRQMNEQKYEAEMQDKLQEQLEQSSQMSQMTMPQQAGGAPPTDPSMMGGAPPAGGMSAGGSAAMAGMPTVPNKPTTPQDMMAKAQELAQQILAMPESQKDSELINLKKTDPIMHSVVSKTIEDIRRQAQTAGGSMLMQQQFGKQGSKDDDDFTTVVKTKPKPSTSPNSVLGPFSTLP